MSVYVKFISVLFIKSIIYVFLIMISLVFLLNLISELEFFRDLEVGLNFTIFLSILNSPTLIFEMFPFIMLISAQLFFIKVFEKKEIDIFKYSGLKNTKILTILCSLSLIIGIILVTIFYNFSSNLKNIYLEIKSNYTNDGKYLAVITKNGIWIKDRIDNKILITNSSFIEKNFLIDNFITELDEDFNVIRNIKSEKINILNNDWIILNASVYQESEYSKEQNLKLKTNFNHKRIKTLYSNLSALSLFELYKLRESYKKLNYSLIDLDLHIFKIIFLPIFLVLITLFSSLIMFRMKQINGTAFKVTTGLFCSVIIYYLNNFSYVLGSTEKIPVLFSLFVPMVILLIINFFMIYKVNEK